MSRMRQSARAEKIKERAAWLREHCKPFSAEEAKEEAHELQVYINIHGISAFDNPMFADRVRWAMTAGFEITFPSDEELVRVFRDW